MEYFNKEMLISMNILEELGLNYLPEEERNRLLNKMVEVVNKRITLRVIDELSDENYEIFSKLIERNPQEAIDFLVNKVDNFQDLIMDEIAKFKDEILTKFSYLEPPLS